jgi:Spy/CpxP family protein refolding chaperone
VAALRLTADQERAIDRIYRRTLRERLDAARQGQSARAHLERLLNIGASDDQLEAAATHAADADAALSRLRTLMLYRMSRVLTPKQRADLAALARTRRDRHPSIDP